MPETPNETEPQAKPQSSARERLKARTAKQTRTAKPPRAASPTRAIEPGLVHYRAAEGLLTAVKERAAARGIDLDVGEFPALDSTGDGTDDPQKLAKLTAHALARVADRFTFARKVTRHFEGTERRAGVLSDIAAAMYALWRRNPEAVEQLARNFGQELTARRAAQAPAETPETPIHNGGQPQHASV